MLEAFLFIFICGIAAGSYTLGRRDGHHVMLQNFVTMHAVASQAITKCEELQKQLEEANSALRRVKS